MHYRDVAQAQMGDPPRLQFGSGTCPTLCESVSLDKMNQTGEMLAKANS